MLTCIEHPEKEPVSLLQVKAYTRIDHDHDDDMLMSLIKTARQVVETYTARSLLHQVWRYTLRTQSAVSFSDHDYFYGGRTRGQRGIELPRSPFVKLVEEPKLVRADVKVPLGQYRLDTAGRIAHIHFNGSYLHPYSYESMIEIDFQSGYGEDPDHVPEPLRQAILMTVADLYDRPHGSNDNGGVILSADVIQLIRPFKVMRLI